MKKYITAKYRYRRFGDKYFLTSDTSRVCVLTEKEWNLFRHNCFTDKSLDKLKNSHIVLDEDNFVEAINLNKKRYEVLMAGTNLHIIVVTLRCNMHCVYCQVNRKYCDDSKYDMNIETAIKTVDFIFQSPNKEITIEFQGGEPTLNLSVLKFIVEYGKRIAKKKNKDVVFTMVTNMTTMTDEMMNYFVDNEVDVCTSLDGNELVHNYNRKYQKNNYKEVLFWIKRFNNEYKKRNSPIRMSALVTLTNESLKYPKEIVDTYIDVGVEVIHLRPLTKLGFAKKAWDKISYTTDEYLDFWIKAVNYIEELKAKNICINERMVLMAEEKIGNDEDTNYMDLRSPCGATIGQIAYNYDGCIYTCDEARMIKNDRFRIGNVEVSKYDEVIKCDKCFSLIFDSTNTQFECCEKCIYQPYCGICPVLNFAMHGTTILNPEKTAMCKIMKIQFDWVVKRYFLE